MNALDFLLEVKQRQETRYIFCNTWLTPMPHTWSPYGWVCSCGECVPFDADAGVRVIVSGGEAIELDNQSNNEMEL